MVSDGYRSVSGISYQMQSMDSAYNDKKDCVPVTKLFQETVNLYRNQNSRFQELLKEAKRMIEYDNAQSVKDDTDVFIVDFNNCPDMSFAHVNSLSYKGQQIAVRPKWRDLYMTLLKKLYVDYRNEIDNVVGKIYGRASAPFVGDHRSISSMRSPGEFAPDRYVELNISATTIIANIKAMLGICGVGYKDILITYTKGNKNEKESPSKGQSEVQNIGTASPSELLSIVRTIISDTFSNGLRKSSKIARKKFAIAYKNNTGTDLPDELDIDALALQVGLEYEDKIYVPSEETKDFLRRLIDEIRKENYDDLKISGWALNSEYFCSILHELRDDTTYRFIVDALVVVPAGADTRDTEAVKRITTAYLKLLFPNVRKPEDIDSRDFNKYCLRRACNMRATIKMQLGIMDSEYRGKDIQAFKVAEIN